MSHIPVKISDYSQIAPLSEHIESQYLTWPSRLSQNSLTVTAHLKEDTSETHSDKLNVTEAREVFTQICSRSDILFIFTGIITAGFSSQEASVTFFLVLICRHGCSKIFNIKSLGDPETKPFKSLRLTTTEEFVIQNVTDIL